MHGPVELHGRRNDKKCENKSINELKREKEERKILCKYGDLCLASWFFFLEFC